MADTDFDAVAGSLNNNVTQSQIINTLIYRQFGDLIIVGGSFRGNGTSYITTGYPANYYGAVSVRNQSTGAMSLYLHDDLGRLSGWDGSTDRVFTNNIVYQMSGILYPKTLT